MPLDAPPGPVAERVERLNDRYRHHGATAVLGHALADPDLGRVALVSSFGAESVVLLHLVSVMAPATPVLFVDTRMLFAETLAYQRQLADRLNLRDIRVIRANATRLAEADAAGDLHARDADACCALRKTEPLDLALAGFDGWITGRKRFQGAERQTLDFFEVEAGTGRIKVNPLAHWGRQDIEDYMVNNRLPRHPLVARGYPSIGCAPCTSPVATGEDPRAGRWRGQAKTECGIHFIGGRARRAGGGDMTAKVLVRDDGFHAEDFAPGFAPPETAAPGHGLDLAPGADLAALAGRVAAAPALRIAFAAFSDGRGFTLARQLRAKGYAGRLRAAGHVLADQYAMARRAGFDEVEIDEDLARRQPEDQWRARATWRAHDYQSRLRG